MKIYVLTYNTADKPERRMIEGTYSSMDKAKAALLKLSNMYGNFLADSEISEHELD